jgi:polyhydroxybutyrate depolymerase
VSRALVLTLLAVVFMAIAAGCTTSKTEAASSVTQTIVSGGVSRTYLLYEPASLPAGKVPLMIALHAGGYSAASWESFTRLGALADEKGFIVAYPEWQGGNWDIGCCNATLSSSADVEFIGVVINHLVETADVDSSRVYVTGFSLGGYMAYRLACELPAIAGIGDVGASEYLSTPCHPKHTVSIYEIHGTKDFYGGSCGGKTESDEGCPNGFGTSGYEPSVVQLNEQWRSTDGCPSTALTQVSSSITELTWEPCSDGSGVRLQTLGETGHCWPTPTTCGDFDAAEALWSFLSAHSRTADPVSEEPPPESPPSSPGGGSGAGGGSPGGGSTGGSGSAAAPASTGSTQIATPDLGPPDPAGSVTASRCHVPSLLGHSATEARKLVLRGGCAVGSVSRPKRSISSRQLLVVRSQRPAAGTVHAAKTRVYFTLGPRPRPHRRG